MRVARIFNTYGPRMHMMDGMISLMDVSFYSSIARQNTYMGVDIQVTKSQSY